MSVSFDTVAQIGITLLGVTSIFLVAKKIRWGFVIGLLSQPFWFFTTFHHKQWGIFFLNFVYTGTWILGVYEWFYKKKNRKGRQ
ncbi:hypothetical protein COU91_03705 [Candidatus Saccharibacteria bacterium CG10_big_fil_rev_8_21_14_0_10_47_8]|nr:MAG: hypothetical protein COU91_03705 [Candidatus Saccharibacteria bacterium CG10_big_fil_rev_8_21_14_0_10_47_8]